MTPRQYAATNALLRQALHLKALHADPLVVPFGRGRALEKLFALADALDEAMSEPFSSRVKPWSPWNGIVRTGADSSVGTTEGREP